MVLLTTTPQILHAISLLPPQSTTDLDTTTPLPQSTTDPISHKTLISLARSFRSCHQTDDSNGQAQTYTLSTLLRGTRPYHPPPPPPIPKTAEYLRLRARLLEEQERRDYNVLLSPTSSPTSNILLLSSDNADEQQDDHDDISPSLVLNILLSTLLCGFAVWYVSYPLRNDGLRVLVGLLGAVVVAVAEVVVYAGYVGKVRQARRRRRRRERAKARVDGRKGDRGEAVVVSTEVWGRGVNGGVRRRVREKWEREQGQGIDKKEEFR